MQTNLARAGYGCASGQTRAKSAVSRRRNLSTLKAENVTFTKSSRHYFTVIIIIHSRIVPHVGVVLLRNSCCSKTLYIKEVLLWLQNKIFTNYWNKHGKEHSPSPPTPPPFLCLPRYIYPYHTQGPTKMGLESQGDKLMYAFGAALASQTSQFKKVKPSKQKQKKEKNDVIVSFVVNFRPSCNPFIHFHLFFFFLRLITLRRLSPFAVYRFCRFLRRNKPRYQPYDSRTDGNVCRLHTPYEDTACFCFTSLFLIPYPPPPPTHTHPATLAPSTYLSTVRGSSSPLL